MQIVIDIDDEDYKRIQDIPNVFNSLTSRTYSAIRNGTPLPKGHGRLIDADEFEELFSEECVGDCGACVPKRKTDGRGRWYSTCLLVDNAPTLIEADTESEDNG